MKALFCADGSDVSIYAFKKALGMLKETFKIDIVTVMDLGFFPTYVSFPSEEEDGFPEQKTIAKNILSRVEDVIEDHGFEVSEKIYLSGKPAESIMEITEKGNYNLIVLGSHGKGGISKWLGSTSRKVVTRSPVPVFVARPGEDVESTSQEKEILITTDGSACSFFAAEKFSEIVEVKDCNVEIMTVKPGVESLPLEIVMDNEWLEKCLDKQTEIASEVLNKTKKIVQDGDKDTAIKSYSLTVREGNAAEQIIDYIHSQKKDLIVLGSHGREGVSDLLLGSVSKRVLDHAKLPVIIIPQKT